MHMRRLVLTDTVKHMDEKPSVMLFMSGLSHPFLGMGPGPIELGKFAAF